VGKGGNIQITTGLLSVSNGAALSTNTDGQGNAGNITINAHDTVTFEGFGGESALPSWAISSVGTDAVGNGGDIRVTARALLLKNGGQFDASSFGQGSGGNIIINASDTVSFDGVGKRLGSGAYSLMQGSMGKGRDIQVTTGSLSVTNGAQLSTNGQGNVGNITIDARDAVKFDGIGNGQASGAFSALLPGKPGKGGDIQVKAGSLSVINGALINASSLGQGNGGNVTIDARDTVTFEGSSNGNSSGIFSLVFPDAVGQGGNLRVTARILSMNNNAGFLSSTLGQGNAGNIFVRVSENISIANSSGIDAGVLSEGMGKGGTVDINTRNLTLTNGSGIGVGVYRAQQVGERLLPASRGKGGNIRINASDSVTLSGYDSKGFSSAIATLTERGALGDAGDITVTTGKFRAMDGAGISAATFNEGKGGDITINANIFELIDGGQVLTNTRSSGNAGNIYLNVKDRITITGSDPNFNQRIAQVEERLRTSGSTDQLTDVVTNQGAASGLFASTTPSSTDNGGNIIIDPRQMTVKDGGSISVNSEGTGNTGNISIQAGTLTLDNATITARAASRTGGNINLNLGNLLLLRNGSEISTTAGIAGAGGDGGNITIDTPFIIAIPGENSDITANAFTGRGGNVNITTQGIFGIEFRPQQTSQSDITASSSFGISGVVDINSLDTDSVQNNLAEFSQNPIDTNNLIANSCVTRSNNQQSTFYIIGSSGFPTRPSSLQISPYPIATAPSVSTASQSSKLRQQRKISELIVEAQGVYQLENGQLVLSRECP
jgi:large exoprotein involved in heme utilization and adhesion